MSSTSSTSGGRDAIPEVDLSHLSVEERETIAAVLARANSADATRTDSDVDRQVRCIHSPPHRIFNSSGTMLPVDAYFLRTVSILSVCFDLELTTSVPQGSVLGPRLFIMYSADLADKAAEHDINFHGYADDTQLCVHCRSVSHVMRSINVRYLLTYLLTLLHARVVKKTSSA